MLDIKNLADTWMRMTLAKNGSDVYKENFWAYEAITDLCISSPQQCLAVIDLIVLSNNTDLVLSNLAAGPVEDLLVQNGEQVISSVMQYAKKNPDWKRMLAGVWKNSMSDDVWTKLQSVTGPTW